MNGNEIQTSHSDEVFNSPSESSLMAVNRAEVDIQVSTAKRYPRKVSACLAEATTLATMNEEIAGSCIYALPRGGKSITGPSVRLAEIIAASWGNLRVEARNIGDDEHFTYSEAVAWDLEKNTAVKVQKRRRITGKGGKRYDDDMISLTANAASSIALRDAVFRIVPRTYIDQIYAIAVKVSCGDAKSISSRRNGLLEHFAKLGVTKDKVLAAVDANTPDDIGIEQLTILRGYANAIRDGELSIDEAFKPKPKEETPPATGEKTKIDFKPKAEPKPAAPAPEPEPPSVPLPPPPDKLF